MKRAISIFLVLVLMFSLCLTGCNGTTSTAGGSQATASGAAPSGEPIRIGFEGWSSGADAYMGQVAEAILQDYIDDVNLFNEMKFTSILHKVKNTDPTSFPAWKVLRMATIEAAQCMGMEESVGSLRAGKKADVVLVALDTPAMSPVLAWPVRNIVPNLVYSASGSEVDTVLIDGAFVVENGRMRTIDEDAEIKRANRCAQLLCQRLEATGWEKDMPLAGWTREGYY